MTALSSNDRPMADLNTTPLIDVLLVLLIMFIMTIPVQTHSVAIDLPSAPSKAVEVDPVRNQIGITGAGTLLWNGRAIDGATLGRLLARSLRLPVEPRLELKPDASAPYGVVDRVIADIKRSGATKLGFVGNEAYARF